MGKKRYLELKKKHKAYKKRWKERQMCRVSSKKRLMFQEYLENCEDALSLMIPASGRIYRLGHKPNILIDIYPTALWDSVSLAPKQVDLPNTIPANSPVVDQIEHLREYTPSFNVSDSGVASIFIGRLKTEKQIVRFKERKGSHIFAYDVSPKDGLMWTESDGHVLFQPYEDFKLGEHIATDFQPVPIENYMKNETE